MRPHGRVVGRCCCYRWKENEPRLTDPTFVFRCLLLAEWADFFPVWVQQFFMREMGWKARNVGPTKCSLRNET
jgi:hypothetical protein